MWMLISFTVNNFVFKIIFKDVISNNNFLCQLNLSIKGVFVLFILNPNVKDNSSIFIDNWLL